MHFANGMYVLFYRERHVNHFAKNVVRNKKSQNRKLRFITTCFQIIIIHFAHYI